MAAVRLSLTLLALAIFGVAALANGQPNGRIWGGEDAQTNDFPWSASLRVNNVHTCSAVIISNSYLLTAAHCVSEIGSTPIAPSTVNVRVGSVNQYAGGRIVSVGSILIHPSYGSFLHDIALVRLSEALTFDDRVQKVELPVPTGTNENGESEFEAVAHGTPVYVPGWGELSTGSPSFRLQRGVFNTVDSPNCELAVGFGYASCLCLSSAELQGVCRGDDGAGVVDDTNILRGIVSFFFGDCGSRYPDVSSSIAYYYDWIKSNEAA